MKNAKNTLLVLIIIFMASCGTYTQVLTLSPTNKTGAITSDSFYVYENDTIKIAYSFWAQSGKVNFVITNKCSKPIYIDWKKCSYVFNGKKYNYYKDEISTEYTQSGYSSNVGYGTRVNKSRGKSETKVEERVMFIPPNTSVNKSKFSISNVAAYVPDAKHHRRALNDIGGYTYKNDTNYLFFRNFITYSLSENFDKEQYIDHGFYVSNITTMTQNDFMDENRKIKSPLCFYNINISPYQLTSQVK